MNPFDATTVTDWIASFDHIVVLDIETYYDDEYSLGKATNTEYVRDERFAFQSLSLCEYGEQIDYFRTDEIDDAVELMKTYSDEGKTWLMVGHNLRFDASALLWHKGIKPTWYCCTMCMSQGLWPTEPASLEQLAVRLWPNDKTMRKGKELVNFKGVPHLSDEQHVTMKGYNDQDVRLTHDAFGKMLSYGYPLAELYQIHMCIRMYVEPSFVVDRPLMRECIKDDEEAAKDAILTAYWKVREYCELADKHIPVPHWTYDDRRKLFSSNDRLAKLLQQVYELETPTKINKNNETKPAFAKKDVEFIEFKAELVELQPIWDARELATSNQSLSRAKRFLSCSEPGPLNPDGKLPVPLKYYGAHTGRYSGNDKINMQNLQRKSRHRLALTAPKGCMVHVEDLSNIEGRMNAWFNDQQDLLDDFRAGVDIYIKFAGEKVYHRDWTQMNKYDDELERMVGKVCILGLGYGMGWKTFQRSMRSGPMGAPPIACDRELAEKCVYGYRDKYHMIAAGWRLAGNMILQMQDPTCNLEWGPLRVLHNSIMLPNGMYLQFPRLHQRTIEHAGGVDIEYVYWNGKYWARLYGAKLIENIVQALSGIVIKESMEGIDRWLQKERLGGVTLQVHDENVIVAKCGADNHITGYDYADWDTERKHPIPVWSNPGLSNDIQGEIRRIMQIPPSWCPDLPLASEGGWAKEYSK